MFSEKEEVPKEHATHAYTTATSLTKIKDKGMKSGTETRIQT